MDNEQLLKEKEEEFLDFQKTSKEYEQALEAEIRQLEQEKQKYEQQCQQQQLEMQQLQNKYKNSLMEQNQQYSKLMQDFESISLQKKELEEKFLILEQENDDLERKQRIHLNTIKDLELKVNQLLENKALLESDIEMKKKMEIDLQRLKDQLRDAQNEIEVLKASVQSQQNANGHAEIPKQAINEQQVLTPKPTITEEEEEMDPLLERVKQLEKRLLKCREMIQTV